MVDYTKPAMRDESWRRWKGGAKLAEDLRQFYTNKRVWDRLGMASSPISSSTTSNKAFATTKAHILFRMIGGGGRVFAQNDRQAAANAFAARLAGKYGKGTEAAADVSQSGADLRK